MTFNCFQSLWRYNNKNCPETSKIIIYQNFSSVASGRKISEWVQKVRKRVDRTKFSLLKFSIIHQPKKSSTAKIFKCAHCPTAKRSVNGSKKLRKRVDPTKFSLLKFLHIISSYKYYSGNIRRLDRSAFHSSGKFDWYEQSGGIVFQMMFNYVYKSVHMYSNSCSWFIAGACHIPP